MALHPFPHLTADEAHIAERAFRQLRLVLEDNLSRGEYEMADKDTETVAVLRSLETAAAECRIGAERTSPDVADPPGVIRLEMKPMSRLTDWRIRLAVRLVPDGWFVSPQPTMDARVAETGRAIDRFRYSQRVDDVVAAGRAIVEAIVTDDESVDDRLGDDAVYVLDLRDRLELLDRGAIGPKS